ncbi:MAG: hypothetical protein KAQ83_02700 [Nanoarchaeota archaeon]|nr:hypothetical protein [Nanoarchaeota archaeon]
MKTKTIFGLFALLVVGMIISTGLVNAYRGDYSVEGPDYNEERHELMESVFANLDYDAWKLLMTENGRSGRVVDMVNEDNFAIFVEAHEAGKQGDHETAAALRAELGLNNGNGPRDGTGFGKGNGQGRNDRQSHFIDANQDGKCDNEGTFQGRR